MIRPRSMNGNKDRNNNSKNNNNSEMNKDKKFDVESRNLIEEENDRDVEALAERIGMMKDIASGIGTALENDKRQLDEMGSSFDRVSTMMRGAVGNVNKMLQTGGSKHMCYLVSFILGLFFVLYWLMK